MKHILLRKHKNYSEDYKVFILNFSKSTKDILKNSNIFTKGCIIPTCITLIKKFFGKNTKVLINIMDQTWSNGVIDEINTINFSLNITRQTDLRDKIHNLEMFYQNWGYYEKDYEKYGDFCGHLISNENEYTDVNDLIKDMNIKFNSLYKEKN